MLTGTGCHGAAVRQSVTYYPSLPLHSLDLIVSSDRSRQHFFFFLLNLSWFPSFLWEAERQEFSSVWPYLAPSFTWHLPCWAKERSAVFRRKGGVGHRGSTLGEQAWQGPEQGVPSPACWGWGGMDLINT